MQDNEKADFTVLGMEVPLAEIDARFRKLWENETARTKASLMNFVVYSERKGALLENHQLVRTITRDHACRAILVEMDQGQPSPRSRAWIDAHCHLIGGRSAVCSEQISFKLEGYETGRLNNLVFSHLDSDLPMVFWWQGDFSPLFTERLYRVIDRLIYDSASWSRTEDNLAIVQKALEKSQGRLVVQDLEWTRTFQHRLVFSGLFDEPMAGQLMAEPERLNISHGSDHRNGALMFLAWLMVQAGWRISSVEGEVADSNCLNFKMQTQTRHEFSVIIELDAVVSQLGEVRMESGLCRALVKPADDGKHLKFELMPCCQGEGEVSAKKLGQAAGGGGAIRGLAPALDETTEAVVDAQLSKGRNNSLLLKVLPVFGKILNGSFA